MLEPQAPRTIAEALKQAEQVLATGRAPLRQGRATGELGSGFHRDGPAHSHTVDDHALNFRHEAETLLCWVCGWNRTQMVLRLGEKPDAAALLRLREAVRQRVEGTPLQYIVGEAQFLGHHFTVRPGCLIPRPETEILADAAIRWVEANRPKAGVVDLGTGSGILAISVALACAEAKVTALDVSEAAVAIARENADRLQADVQVAHCDGLRWLDEHSGQFQVLVSNPPYIETEAIETLDDEVRLFEPRLALDGGPDGLVFYRALASRAKVFTPDGPLAIFLEVGAGQAESVLNLFRTGEGWDDWTFDVIPDLRGIHRVVWGQRLG